MRYIGLKDTDGTMIFEGDTLEITKREDMNFSEDFLNYFNIDKLTIKVLESIQNEIGVSLNFYFSSNGKNISFDDMIEYHKDKDVSESDLLETYPGNKKGSDFFSQTLSLSSSFSFHHTFIHRSSKKIVDMEYKGEREIVNERTLSNKLRVNVYGERYKAHNTRFLVKLNEKTKKRVEEFVAEQDEAYDEGTLREGYFTHILLTPRSVSLYDYEIKASPVNSDLEHTWIESNFSRQKYYEISRPLKEALRKRLDKWKEDNAHLDEEVLNEKYRAMWRKEMSEIKKLEFSEESRVKEPCTSIVFGISRGKDLIDFFVKNECEIEPMS